MPENRKVSSCKVYSRLGNAPTPTPRGRVFSRLRVFSCLRVCLKLCPDPDAATPRLLASSRLLVSSRLLET